VAALAEILEHLDALLEPARFHDYGPNGLQVPGAERVARVATGVSANLELLERSRDAGAQLVLVHHGLFWDADPRALDRRAAVRLRTLLEADVSLAAYHLPLDAHPEVGNNVLLARALGAEPRRPFADHRGEAIGVAAEFPGEGIDAAELVERVREATGREPLHFAAGSPRVRTIGIVTGGGARHAVEAVDAGLDAFLTGEPSEPAMGIAREGAIHFLAAGHYATETLGVRRLGELLAERFGVEHEFVDVPNPV
jgi:dinuclear metal center YbgI/SA1388 family protein